MGHRIGLVLAGGGGKGAYQIGVWKAMRETGLDKDLCAISGTSVGGLNAALIMQGDLKKAERVWQDISVEKILTPRLSSREARKEFGAHLKEKGYYTYVRDGMIKIIENALGHELSAFDHSPLECYITCLQTKEKPISDDIISKDEITCTLDARTLKRGKRVYFNMREYSRENRLKLLLATSAIPIIFPQEEIGGCYYVDGGWPFGGDNTPIEPLVEKEHCDKIIVIHLERDVEYKRFDHSDDPNIREIRPKDDQGGLFTGTLNFYADDANRRILQGYNDNIEKFRKISEDWGMLTAGPQKWAQTALEDRISTSLFNSKLKKLAEELRKL